ncbi:MAG: hypothetical protein EXR79_03300 [Myxococcales bacterium]|nr:hypothetical protein [Myxococcales bacterium]
MDTFGFGPLPLLALSIGVLALGPLSHVLAGRAGRALQALDGFVLVSVGGLVLADVLPHALGHGGWLVLPIAVLGLVGPAILERALHRAAARVHTAALVLGLMGLVLHAGIDGLALAGSGDGGLRPQLATAVVLHRLPEGLTIWWLLRPVHGRKVALGALGLVAAATAVGTLSGMQGLAHGGAAELWLVALEALVGGSLLHVVLHRPHPLLESPAPGRWHVPAALGALAGGALVALMLAQGEGHHAAPGVHGDVHASHLPWGAGVFWRLAADSAPALLLAYAAAGLVQTLLPGWSTRWMRQGGTLGQGLRGVAFGLPLPICSCGVVPVYRGLVLRGVPPAAAFAFLVATPELGLDAVLLSLPLLGGPFALARVIAAATVALGVGLVMARLLPAPPPVQDIDEQATPGKAAAPVGSRVVAALRVGFGEVVDHTGPWVLLGLAVAAVAAPLLEDANLAAVPTWASVPLFALIGMPVYVCASGATPLVAVLVAAGVSPGAGLAFLLTGPATNVATFGVVARLHGDRAALVFGATMAGLAILAGWLVDVALPGYHVPVAAAADHGHGIGTAGSWALAVFGVALLVSLLRQGPRAFAGQVLAFANGDPSEENADHSHPHGGHDHDHEHEHEHEHKHGGPAAPPSP